MAFIDTSELYNPIFRHDVGGRGHSFSFRGIPKEIQPWLMDVVARHLDEAYADGVADTTKQFKASLRKALMMD